MATPKKTPENKPAKTISKKVAPPELCTCGRPPVVSKVKRSAYIVGCPHWQDCDNCDNCATSGRQPTEAKAVEAWDRIIAELKGKERAKK